MAPRQMIHQATLSLLPFFDTEHLPDDLQIVSQPFGDLAHFVAESLHGPEATVAIRKLLEAKDCAVRAALSNR